MGANMVRRLMKAGHAGVVFNKSAGPTEALAKEGATAAASPADLVAKLERPRTVCIMIPAASGSTTSTWERAGASTSPIASWLLDLTAQALAEDPTLEAFGGKVSDSGEGRWTIAAANDTGVPAFVLTAALFERFASRDEDVFQNKVLSAMRHGFGGHHEKR